MMRYFIKSLCVFVVVLICISGVLDIKASEENSFLFDQAVVDVFEPVTVESNIDYLTIDNFAVLDDGGFAIVYNNQYVCQYSSNMSLLYCLKMRNPAGATLVESKGEYISVISSRNKIEYEITIKNNTISLIKNDVSNWQYDRDKWDNNKTVEVVNNNRIFKLDVPERFIVADCNGEVLFERIADNQSQNTKFIIIPIILLVAMFVIMCLKKWGK